MEISREAKVLLTESYIVRYNNNPDHAILHGTHDNPQSVLFSNTRSASLMYQLVIMVLRRQLLRSKVLKPVLKRSVLLEELGKHLEGRPKSESVHLQEC